VTTRGWWAGKTVSEGGSLERKLAFRLVESVKQSEEEICEGVSVLAMMCIAKVTGCVVLPRVSSSYRQVQRRSVLSRVTCA